MVVIRPTSNRNGWDMLSLVESDAEQKLEQLVIAQQWEAARLLAQTHDLDLDIIHK